MEDLTRTRDPRERITRTRDPRERITRTRDPRGRIYDNRIGIVQPETPEFSG